MVNHLALIEEKLNRISVQFNQPESKNHHLVFSLFSFSLFLCLYVMGILWRKSNNQHLQNEGLQKKLNELEIKLERMSQGFEDEKSKMIRTLQDEWNNRSERIQEDFRDKFTALDSRFHSFENEKFRTIDTLRGELTNQSKQIQDFESRLTIFNDSFHPKDGQVDWNKITRKPTTISGYGITDFKGFIGRDGYQEFSSGLIMQWGFAITEMNGETKIKFPTEFPSSCLGIHGTHSGGGPAIVMELGGSRSKTEVTLRTFNHSGDTDRGWHIHWLAIGH
ncbi:hypothetical protein KMZ15_06430 [Mycoavidus sp. HKI]|uniref:gp53-like domain-containing protein n=1 Tax=Mycoavidus sp. HKI TaxID=2840467 RepID=UPI001CBC9B07|nr:hypothetical protein [Mycoavidus sp. HKI]UAW63709.1 hypothetical protein KMZ15_06430 [Mycoavidus sp. HKI]